MVQNVPVEWSNCRRDVDTSIKSGYLEILRQSFGEARSGRRLCGCWSNSDAVNMLMHMHRRWRAAHSHRNGRDYCFPDRPSCTDLWVGERIPLAGTRQSTRCDLNHAWVAGDEGYKWRRGERGTARAFGGRSKRNGISDLQRDIARGTQGNDSRGHCRGRGRSGAAPTATQANHD